MQQIPQVRSASPKREFRVGSRLAVLLTDIESANPIVGYRYIVVVLEDGNPQPCLYVTAETNRMIKDSVHAPFLATFDERGHTNFGQSMEWADEDTFVKKAQRMITDRYATRH